MSYAENRDAKAWELGYADWAHLIRSTGKLNPRDVAAMTGYGLSTVTHWRAQLHAVETPQQRRDAIARKCGYQHWEHLMWVTRKMPEDVVMDMTGYTLSTIKAWRRKLLGPH